MKYVVILGDGMADFPIESLGNKTPLSVANKPNIDNLAKRGESGLCRTVPCGMKPGSDVANLSVLGYDPLKCYTGRSSLEAASIGIQLKDTDVTARANLVTLSDEENFEDKSMIDYSSGEISTEDAVELIKTLAEKLNCDEFKLYAGVSYRHCFVADKGVIAGDLTPPHDITGKPIKEYLPKSDAGKKYLEIMKKSVEILKDHPVNLRRIAEGKRPASSLWFWGEGTKPELENFTQKTGLKGAMISAVDLLKGIAILAQMEVLEVEGATGKYDTNFSGKAEACIDAFKRGVDFVYIHMEAPDECGHHGDIENKVYSIELIDEKVVKPVVEYLRSCGEDFAVLVTPDHLTPICTMTHCGDPVPYVIYKSNKEVVGVDKYDEPNASSTGIFIESGVELMQKFLER